MGIKFGSSKATVLNALKAKGGTIDNSYEKDPNNLAFNNLKYGSRYPDVVFIRFVNDKAFEADFDFKPKAEGQLLDDYKSMVDALTDVYGKGRSIRNYTSPYKDGEDVSTDLIGISAGKIELTTIWMADNKNTVNVAVTSEELIEVQYQDDILTGEAIKSQKAKDKGDM